MLEEALHINFLYLELELCDNKDEQIIVIGIKAIIVIMVVLFSR